MSKEGFDPLHDIKVIESGDLSFTPVQDGWARSLCETGGAKLEPYLVIVRTNNGPALTEKINKAQRDKVPPFFHYPDLRFNQIPQQALILAAKSIETEDGPILKIWVGLTPDDIANLTPA